MKKQDDACHAACSLVACSQGLWRGTVPGLLLTVPYTAVQFVALHQIRDAAASMGLTGTDIYDAVYGAGAQQHSWQQVAPAPALEFQSVRVASLQYLMYCTTMFDKANRPTCWPPALLFTTTLHPPPRNARAANPSMSTLVSLGSGALAGAAGTVASYPFDLLRTTLAAQGEPKVRNCSNEPMALVGGSSLM